MSNTQRFSISLNNEKGTELRSLVDDGVYPSLSAAVDTAVGNLLELERERKAWWDEVVRRCEEGKAHPERMEDPDTFFRKLRAEIAELKASRNA